MSPPPLELNGVVLDNVSSYKYLGVTLTSVCLGPFTLPTAVIGLIDPLGFFTDSFTSIHLLHVSDGSIKALLDLTWTMHLLCGTLFTRVKLKL